MQEVMPWPSSSKEELNKPGGRRAPGFVEVAGGLLSKFLLRRPSRKRASSSALVLSSDVSTPLGAHDDEEDVDIDIDAVGSAESHDQSSTTKPSVIAVPTPDRPTASSGAKKRDSVGSGSSSSNSPLSSATNSRSLDAKRQKMGNELSEDCQPKKAPTTPSPPVPSRLFQPTCYNIFPITGRQCTNYPIAGDKYCELHTRRTADPKSQRIWHAFGEHDLWFHGRNSNTQCVAITPSNRRCQEMSIQHFELCRRHLKYPPKRCVIEVPTPDLPKRSKEDKSRALNDSDSDDDMSSSSGEESSSNDDDSSFVTSSSSEDSSIQEEGRGRAKKRRSSQRTGSKLSSSVASKDHAKITSASSCGGSRRRERSPSSDSSSSDNPYYEPTKFDHSRDTLFTGEGKRRQCHYQSADGVQCCYRRKKGTDIYCFGHDVLTPLLYEGMAKRGIKMDMSDDEDNKSSTASEISSDESQAIVWKGTTRTYTHKEFVQMWKNFEEFHASTDEIESSRMIRGANQSMSAEDTDGQAKAQYGRLLPRAMKRLIKDILALEEHDVFLDIGHGIGNTCMHAAFTVGCEARGIEVVGSRNCIANAFLGDLLRQHRLHGESRIAGNIVFRHGRLEDDEHRKFLTQGVTKAIVNNFNGVFAERSVKNNCCWFLDDYCAGIFALMAPGTCLVTLHPLALGPSLEQANATRRKHKLKESANASFYEMEKVVLGKACDTVKWNKKSGNENLIYVYKYSRVPQDNGPESVFLCCNPNCILAKDCVAIPATTLNDEGRCVINRCGCGVATKMLRQRKRISYS